METPPAPHPHPHTHTRSGRCGRRSAGGSGRPGDRAATRFSELTVLFRSAGQRQPERRLTSDPVRCWPMGGQDSPGDRRERAARATPPTGRERA